MIDWAMLAQAADNVETSVSWGEVLFLRCGPIGYVLWGMNALTWALVVKYFIDIRRETVLPTPVSGQLHELFENRQYREALEMTADDPSFLSGVVNSALSQASYGYAAMERGMEDKAEEHTTDLLRRIEWLNLIGNIGPMLGLMGTVLGMIGAFFSIVEEGQAKPEAMANDIGGALVTTLLGLVVAVPALSTYTIMRNRIDGLASEGMTMAQEMIAQLRPAKKSS